MSRRAPFWSAAFLLATSCAGTLSLQQAAANGMTANVEVMLNNGVKVDQRDMSGDTALIAAARAGQAKTAKLLLDRGASVNARGDLGVTALTVAAARGNLEIVILLARKGADLGAAEYDGRNAATLARGYGHYPVADWLAKFQAGQIPEEAPKSAPPQALANPDLNALMNRALGEAPAYNNKSADIVSDVDKPAYQLAVNAKRLAVVIGIENYKAAPPARFAGRDAAAVRNHLYGLGYPPGNVIYLTDSIATKAAIERAVETWLARKSDADATIFFYFSGHGAADPRGGESFLLPWDGNYNDPASSALSVKRLLLALSGINAKAAAVVIEGTATPALPDAANALTLLGACASNEEAGALEAQGHGLFTYYFLKGFSLAAAARGDLTARALHAYLGPMVASEARKQSRRQTPQLIGAEHNLILASFK